ncbi:MAG: tetratricopeptide repeat protein, partial [Spirulinaceae cyanobacterium]
YHQLGNVAEALRDWEQARSHYQQALDLNIEFNDRYSQASTYHQLGRVAEVQRDWEQARSHYQQALDLKIVFNDRYSQAGTYCCLGSVSRGMEEYEQAKAHYQKSLELYAEFNDTYSIETFIIPNFTRLYQTTQDDSILTTVAEALGMTVEQVRERFAQVSEG